MAENLEYYRMGRGAVESLRLTLQHTLFEKIFGWSLHPSITTSWSGQILHTSRKVADVACGNGIWAVELAISDKSRYGDLEVVGLDISSANFPHPSYMPQNLKLAVWDMNTPPPEEYRETFDVVNVRLILAAVSKGNVDGILHNMLDLLKPGGYLQWAEVDTYTPPVASSLPDNSLCFSIIPNIFTAYGAGTHDDSWIVRLPDICEASRCKVLDNVRALPPPWMRKYFWDNWLVAQSGMVNNSKSPELEKFFNDYLQQTMENQHDLPMWYHQVVLCQKPALLHVKASSDQPVPHLDEADG